METSRNPVVKRPTISKLPNKVTEENRNRPNHFIALPVSAKPVVDVLKGIQDEYLTLSESDGEEFKKEWYNLHITLCAVRVDNPDQLDTVTQTLYDLIVDRQFEHHFTLSKLGSFWNRVLYAGATVSESFIEFVLQLREALAQKGIKIFDETNEFTPHVTLFNFPRSKTEIYFPIDDFIAIKSDDGNDNALHNVEVPLDEVVIYSMERDDSNRYISKMSLDLQASN